MRAALWIVVAASANAFFAGSMPAHSQAPAINCDRPGNADGAAFCRQTRQDAPLTDCDRFAASESDPKRKAAGVPFDKIDPTLAIPACERAVRQYPTSVRLIFQVGRAYSKKGNHRSALAQYQKAAERGYAPAQHNLGVMYERAQGVNKDYARAVAWYRKAAEQGHLLAQFNLGNMYRTGRGVPRDFAEALKWLRKAGEQGDARASVILGLMYADGQGVATDYAESAKWFRVAAQQGDARAQRILGIMYEHGGGVPKNLAEATEWYGKAAAQGDAEAQRKHVALDADARAGRAAEEAGNAALQAALAEGNTADQAWEKAALAAGRAARNVEVAAGRPDDVAGRASRQAEDQVRSQAAKARAEEPSTIVVEMSVAVTPTNPPVVIGNTNLPDGTILMVHLLGDPPACVPQCGLEYESSTVQNGRFTTSLKGSSPLISGSYTIDIVTPWSPFQPEAVQSVIGKFGENLRGPYVETLEGGKFVPVRFPRSTAPLDGYLSIHYRQKIHVEGDAATDATVRRQAISDIREWMVKSCTSDNDFVNALVSAGSVTGRDIVGAERQAKIDGCIADFEAQLQAAPPNPQQTNAQPAASETRVPTYTKPARMPQSATPQEIDEAKRKIAAGIGSRPAQGTPPSPGATPERPELAVPGHYPDGRCTAGEHRWATPVQGYLLDWCTIALKTDGKGNYVATAYVDSPVQLGLMDNTRSLVRYDFDCAGHFAINLSPPMPLTGLSGVSVPYLIGNAVCTRAKQLLYEREQKGG